LRRALLWTNHGVFLILLLPLLASVQWKLDNDNSTVSFVSIKKSSVGEVSYFKKLSGSVAKDKAEISIDLASVESNIPIRNERMQSMLFEVEKFAKASVSGAIDSSKVSSLKAGETYSDQQKMTLDLHGMTKQIEVPVRVTKLANDGLLITSEKPMIIKADDYALVKGIDKLREVAGLPVISTSVPVSFNLVFRK